MCLHSASGKFAFYIRTGLMASQYLKIHLLFTVVPTLQSFLSLNFIIHLYVKKRGCLLKLSSSSMVVVPGLRYLKGAMKVDSMLTFSRRKQKKRNIRNQYFVSAF